MTSAGRGWGDFSIVLEGPWTLISVEAGLGLDWQGAGQKIQFGQMDEPRLCLN